MLKRTVAIAFVCLLVPCWGEEPVAPPDAKPITLPTLEKRDSPAVLLKKNTDGTLLVSLKPQVYLDELGCVMVSDAEGNTFSQMHYMIAFSLEKIRYRTLWGTSPGGGPPVKLDPQTEYQCLIETPLPAKEREDVACSILKIWQDGKLIYERKEVKRGVAGPTDVSPEKKTSTK